MCYSFWIAKYEFLWPWERGRKNAVDFIRNSEQNESVYMNVMNSERQVGWSPPLVLSVCTWWLPPLSVIGKLRQRFTLVT